MPQKNIAHRGFSGEYPENTLLAFEKAVEEGRCDGFETDVHLSADGELVIIHDDELDRTTNGSGPVSVKTRAELLELDAGIKKGERFAGQRIPLLAQVLDVAKKHSVILNIELKNMPNPYPGLEAKVIQLVRDMGMVEQVQLSSFNHLSIALCKRLAPDIYAGLLYSQPLYRAEEYAKSCGADALNLHYLLLYYEPELAARCKALGIELNLWTVNESADMARLQTMVDSGSIITNYPNRMREAMAG
ncbi:glycerophosphoryl diester phosphodiesterase [Clostridia bacterium]|nr:glycerophosphoryl diester phosphodiesterase [Clostridia bacterium]